MTDEERAKKAEDFFNEGWSLNIAMSKAGFASSWSATKIRYIDVIKNIIDQNKDRYIEKNRRKAKGKIV